MADFPGVSASSIATDSWEPFIEEGREMGQVHFLVQKEGGLMAGLWRTDPEIGGEIPYNVTGSDTFHVLKGEAELETPDGQKINLIAGGLYSFPDGFSATWRTRSPFVKFFVIA
ncbi:cupin domain-containing protein [Streptomyces sp. NBC_00424]|uniref:cupin domain-containing protein n=1 Tax=Streptomyces sp. NBC_00424 TaxID=2903648 RepID=UPI00224DEC7D|nr:cupin domain-containing protein [Streptomyces sp. NBC_00424]MCX5070948.1 cupin domain-containing protein [Streptomyces sp. NBC_00424]